MKPSLGKELPDKAELSRRHRDAAEYWAERGPQK